jgi:transcription elongation factor Elf1
MAVHMEAAACPSCGSKRITAILAGEGKLGTIWCHACGAVTEKEPEAEVESDEALDEWTSLLLR